MERREIRKTSRKEKNCFNFTTGLLGINQNATTRRFTRTNSAKLLDVNAKFTEINKFTFDAFKNGA